MVIHTYKKTIDKSTLLLSLMRRAIQDRALTRRESLSETSALTYANKYDKTEALDMAKYSKRKQHNDKCSNIFSDI